MRLLRAVVSVAVLAALVACTDDAEPEADPRPSLVDVAPLVVADGYQAVGINGVMVEVPVGWTVYGAECLRVEGTGGVYFNENTQGRCVRKPSKPALVLYRRPEQGLMLGGQLTTINGLDVERVDGCRDTGFCAFTEQITVDIQSADVRMSLHGPGKSGDVLKTIASSLQPIPEGFVAVPYVGFEDSDDDGARLLREAGLSAEAPDVDFPHYTVGTVPAAGSVVPAGTHVEIQIGDG